MKILTLKVEKANMNRLQRILAENIPESIILDYSVHDADDQSKNKSLKDQKERFLIKLGTIIKSVPVSDIAYFYTENKSNFLCTIRGKKYPVDNNLDQIEKLLNPKMFFRINRQFIIGYHAIDEMKAHSRSRIIVNLSPPHKTAIIVAIDRALDFKAWISE